MLDIVLSNRFKKDLKLAAKRGYDLDLLDAVVTNLAERRPLAEKYRDHELTGNHSEYSPQKIPPIHGRIPPVHGCVPGGSIR